MKNLNKKTILLLILTIFIIGGIFFLTGNGKNIFSTNFIERTKYKDPLVIEPNDGKKYMDYVDEKVEEQMNKLTLRQKIGQMIMIQTDSTTLTDGLKKDIKDKYLGGVVLFSKNIVSYSQTTTFIDNIQKNANIPLFMAVDEEGGTVQRINKLDGFPYVPAMSSLGAKNNLNLTYQVGQAIGEELSILGFNIDFAPVADVAYNKKSVMYSRSFGSSPTKVADQVVSFANGLDNKTIIPSYKHFPGHGDTTVDSHNDLPILNKTKEQLLSSDLIPFKKAIENDAEIIMIGHLAVPQISSNNTPASLSKEIITDLLKNELGYKGLVITDSLSMGAITKNYTEKQIYEMAITAGVDILLMPKSYNNAINYIEASVKEGKITEEQINNSVRKILSLKYRRVNTKHSDLRLIKENNHASIINSAK